MRNILLLNGPNLDMLGVREPEVYGSSSLTDLERLVWNYGRERGVRVTTFQSNSEGKLIDRIHQAHETFDGIVYNPGAHTHYSYAIRDALGGIDTPCVEVHISDVDSREAFRHISVTAPACVGQIKGRGFQGYCDALDLLLAGARTRLGEGFEERLAPGQVIVANPDELEGDFAVVEDAKVAAAAFAEARERAAVSGEAADAPGEAVGGTPVLKQSSLRCGTARGASPDSHEGVSCAAVSDPVITGPEMGSPSGEADAETAETRFADLAFPAGTCAERLGRLRSALSEAGIRTIIVRDTSNIHWLCGFDGVFDEESAHALLVTPHDAVLHTDSRYSEALRNAAETTGAPVAVNDTRKTHTSFFADVFAERHVGPAARAAGRPEPKDVVMAIEDTITLAEYRKLIASFEKVAALPEIRETDGLVQGLREVKDAAEVARMRAAQAITDAAFSHIVAFMEPGMTEREVQIELEDFMRRHGAEGLAFSSIIATGANGASPHAIPGATRLEAGQCVVMDFGARAHGYCSDMTRTVFLGEPPQRMRDAYRAIREANERVEALIAPGVTGKEAHELAEQVLADGGFGGKMGHALGHGVGIDIHEGPVLAPRNEGALVAGNVVTVEPGVYLPGEFGMRLEDFGVVTEDGFDVFTKSTHEMVIL